MHCIYHKGPGFYPLSVELLSSLSYCSYCPLHSICSGILHFVASCKLSCLSRLIKLSLHRSAISILHSPYMVLQWYLSNVATFGSIQRDCIICVFGTNKNCPDKRGSPVHVILLSCLVFPVVFVLSPIGVTVYHLIMEGRLSYDHQLVHCTGIVVTPSLSVRV
jgi:hypothetical protein